MIRTKGLTYVRSIKLIVYDGWSLYRVNISDILDNIWELYISGHVFIALLYNVMSYMKH